VFMLPLSWLLYAPLGGWVTLRRMLQERARLLINSPADLVYHLLQERFGWSELAAWRATTQASTLAFCLIAAGILAWFWWADRHATTQTRLTTDISPDAGPNGQSVGNVPDALLWRGAMAVTLAYLLVGSFWFQHWYLLWVLAPAVLLPDSRWMLTLLPAYCLGALWSNLTNSFARYQLVYPLNAIQVGAINSLAQVAPLLCVLLVTRIWQDAPRLLAAIRRVRAASRSTVASVAAAQEMDHRS
jgi:hypothetical protein